MLTSCVWRQDETSFYRIANSDGKVWLIPACNMRVGLGLYQPSGRKGKLLKALFPYLHKVSLVRRVVKAQPVHYELQEDLRLLLCQVFHTSDWKFSMFCGTPCVHQKITIQLFKGKHFLGYCKISDSEEVAKLFEEETKTLRYLTKQGMMNIPRCLYCGKTEGNVAVFVQSTIKTNHSQIMHKWTDLQKQFLVNLHEKTKQKLLFESTNFYQTLIELKKHLDWFSNNAERTMIEKAMTSVLSYYAKKEVEFSAYHADFTPWNMLVEDGKLFVFDWEYAKLSYPPYLDVFHFFTQIAILEQGVDDAILIYKIYQKYKCILLGGIRIQDKAYLCYLLHIIYFYFKRNNGLFSTNDHSYRCWISLINILLDNEKDS